jgi:3-dehydroquinate dehydratase
VKSYEPYLDGVLFPYRAESEGGNLQNATLVEQEIATLRGLFKGDMPMYIDVYLTAHSRLGASTAEYVQETVKRGKQAADGVLIYTHPNPEKEPEKYNVVKREFN